MICFFSKSNCSARTKLFQTYCNSRYGCELWSLYDNSINEFDVAWSMEKCNEMMILEYCLVMAEVCQRQNCPEHSI